MQRKEFMDRKYSNPCTRCGKERIKSKTWKETVTNYMNTTVVVHTETVCPDPECQKIVEKDLVVQKEKRDVIRRNKEERAAQNQARNGKSRTSISLKPRKLIR